MLNIQYVTDPDGNRKAVQIPIEEWEALWEQLTDDEVPLTEEDWEAIRAGEAAIKRGEYVTLEEFEKELGL
jgi:PHD/YefM family antitoxin component YafN of YafNO toxin-antitoxin module